MSWATATSRRTTLCGSATAASAAALVLGLAGCSTYAPQAGVEDQIKSKLETSTATCPGDLKGEVGAEITCSATANGQTFDVTVTVTSLQGSNINFDIERVGGTAAPPTATAPSQPTQATRPTTEMTVDSSTGAVDGKDVAQAVFDELTQVVGQSPDEVSCPDLPATAGSSTRCSLKTGAETYGVTVTTTSVEGTNVSFDIKVDDTPS